MSSWLRMPTGGWMLDRIEVRSHALTLSLALRARSFASVGTAPSGVNTSSHIFFADAEIPFCAVCGDGVYNLAGDECTCGDGVPCNTWPLSGSWSE